MCHYFCLYKSEKPLPHIMSVLHVRVTCQYIMHVPLEADTLLCNSAKGIRYSSPSFSSKGTDPPSLSSSSFPSNFSALLLLSPSFLLLLLPTPNILLPRLFSFELSDCSLPLPLLLLLLGSLPALLTYLNK